MAPIPLARRIARPLRGVMIKLSHVSRARSAVTPPAATPATINRVKNSTHVVTWRRNRLSSARCTSEVARPMPFANHSWNAGDANV